MKSVSLTCKSTNCVHNKNCECMAGVITVSGVYATSSPETICVTFVEEGGYSFDNLSSFYDNEKTEPDKITCTAINCIYNENNACYADEVQIMAANASCGTFKCKP